MKAWLLFVAIAFVACGGSSTIEGSAASSGGGGQSGGSGGAGGEGGQAGGGVICNPSGVACNGLPPQCPPGEVPSVENACWGACVPILSCATEPNCDGCNMGFCAEYVAFTTEYRCVLPSLTCSALACSCLAPYFCVDPYDVCQDSSAEHDVTCVCTTC